MYGLAQIKSINAWAAERSRKRREREAKRQRLDASFAAAKRKVK